MTPRSSFSPREGLLLRAVLWGMSALFIAIMITVWIVSERQRVVFLDLETGKPVTSRPAL
ncbi:MAG: hypothetical protein HYU52_02760 [Acidobacteria bacterium]|nr:hypothetical protein [Acidobacteriota bacterium]